MNDLKLIEATTEYAEQLWQFRKEVFEHDPDDGNRFAGCMSIESASSAEEWIKMCQMRKSDATCKQTGVDVPSTTYFAIRKSDNKLVGIIDLRHHINHPILGTWGGHCGYTVRPSERGRGFAKEMLRLNLQNVKAHGIDKVLVTCYSSNKASESVIRANGGVYEKTVVVDGIRIQRFWIDIVSNIKWIFFDIGSTLIDESVAYKNRIERTIADTEIGYDDFYQRMVEIAKYDQNAYNRVVDTYGLKKAPWNSDDEFVYPEAENILQKLSKRYKIGIIANQKLGSEQRLETLGLLKYIDLVIASAEEGVAKPDLRIFQIALERVNCKPEEAVMVGDRLDNDIAPANKIGMKTVWIRQGFGGLSESKTEAEQPDYTVDSLHELLTLFINQSEIKNMEFSHIAEYAELFISVFNAEPWNDSWTKETAQIRIENMMKTGTFIGKVLYADNDLKGLIWGQKEQYYNGTHFQIQEFCVKTAEQNKGYGNALLKALEKALSEIGVVNIYLITSKGAKTEGYYSKRGFAASDNLIMMTKHL